jgi:hypothetical protein
VREFREFKLKALISAILAAQSEFEKICLVHAKGTEPMTSWHGNIKASNVFVECAGQNTNYAPYLLFSDRAITPYIPNGQEVPIS